MKLIKILFTRCSWSHHCAHMIEQGRDLYLSWTMVWSTDTGLGSQNVFTSFVNPSTVVDLFFHPSTSLQASSYSNWKGWILNRYSSKCFLCSQCILHRSISQCCQESWADSSPRPAASWCTASKPLLCWWSQESHQSSPPRTNPSSAEISWMFE